MDPARRLSISASSASSVLNSTAGGTFELMKLPVKKYQSVRKGRGNRMLKPTETQPPRALHGSCFQHCSVCLSQPKDHSQT